MKAKRRKSYKRARSSVTGRFVSKGYAARYPRLTIIETVRVR